MFLLAVTPKILFTLDIPPLIDEPINNAEIELFVDKKLLPLMLIVLFDMVTKSADVYVLTVAASIKIPVGFNEFNVIFTKALNTTNFLLSKEWSYGIAYFTNDLKLNSKDSSLTEIAGSS